MSKSVNTHILNFFETNPNIKKYFQLKICYSILEPYMCVFKCKIQHHLTLCLEYTISSSCASRSKSVKPVLTGEAQYTGHCPRDRRVASLIPGQGTCLGCGLDPRLGERKRQPIRVSLTHPCFSPSLSPSFPFSLKANK